MTKSDVRPQPAEATKGLALVVLAAGVGSRYGGLKQLETIGPSGETLLEYSIFDALRAGFDHVVLVIRPETEGEFRESLGSRLVNRVSVSFVYQELADLPEGASLPSHRNKPWGTGHAVLTVESAIGGPFAVINADDFYGRDAFRAVADFMRTNPPGPPSTFALAGFDVGPTLSEAGPVSRGLCRASESGWLKKIVEVPKLARKGCAASYTDEAGIERRVASEDLVSMNMWGFTPEIFSELESIFFRFLRDQGAASSGQPEFLIPDAVQEMIGDGSVRVRVLRHTGQWCGITFPEDLPRAQAFIASLVQDGEYPSPLWK